MYSGGALAANLLRGGGAAGIQYVGGKQATFTGSPGAISLTDLAGGIDTAPGEDDLVLIWAYYTRSAAAPTTPGISGYTDAFSPIAVAFGSYSRAVLCSKFMSSSPDTTFTPNSATTYGAVHVRVYRGVDLTTPFDVAVQTASNSGSANWNCPAITPSTAGALIAAFGGGCRSNPADPADASDLTAWMDQFINAVAGSATGSGHKTDWTSGAFNPAAVTGVGTGTNNSWIACTVALRPV
jgi:hypothetical protein